MPAQVSAKIQEQFGFVVPVVIRTREEMAAVVGAKPFPDSDDGLLHVYFLGNVPLAGDVSGLDAQRSPGDNFIVSGKEIYVRLPKGMARSKLTNAYFDSKLKTVSTARNWRTVCKLLGMMPAD